MKLRTHRRQTMHHRWRRFQLEMWEKPVGQEWRFVHRMLNAGMGRMPSGRTEVGSVEFRGSIAGVIIRRQQ